STATCQMNKVLGWRGNRYPETHPTSAPSPSTAAMQVSPKCSLCSRLQYSEFGSSGGQRPTSRQTAGPSAATGARQWMESAIRRGWGDVTDMNTVVRHNYYADQMMFSLISINLLTNTID